MNHFSLHLHLAVLRLVVRFCVASVVISSLHTKCSSCPMARQRSFASDVTVARVFVARHIACMASVRLNLVHFVLGLSALIKLGFSGLVSSCLECLV